MIPTLIVLGLLALGVGIVAFVTRRPPTRAAVVVDQDTAWNDPITPANAQTAPGEAAAADPFVHAPSVVPQPLTQVQAAPGERAS